MVADLTRDGIYVTPKIDSLTEEGAKKSRPMKAGSVVMAVSGAPGLPAILTVDACIHDGFVGFRKLSQSIKTEYFVGVLLALRASSEAQAVGATFQNLKTGQINRWQIPIPPFELQKEYTSCFQEVLELEEQQTKVGKHFSDLLQSLLARAFTGKLTAVWREQHTEALAAEARQRDEALGLRARVVRPVEPEVERVAVPLDETHPRYTILHELSSVQQQVYQAMLQTEGYFSAENLMPDSGLSPDIKRRTLTLLELLGLVARVSLPSTPTSHTIFYVPAHRASQATDDGQDDDLATLKAAFSELGI